MTGTPVAWPHQVAAVNAAELSIQAGRQSGLIVLPTGTGKTAVAMLLGRRLGVPMLFLCFRDTLLSQTLQAADRFWPECYPVAIEAGCRTWDEPSLAHGKRPDLAVAMIQTIGNRLGSIAPDRFGIVVVDEAHGAPAPSWGKVLDHFKPGYTLGITATPQRLDGKGLASRFGREPVYTYSLHQAIKDGRLSPFRSERVVTDVDLSDLREGHNEEGDRDLERGPLSERVNTKTRNASVALAYKTHAAGRRGICFCVDQDHAEDQARAFEDAGVRAESVTGRKNKHEQRRLRRAFAAHEYDVLTTCELLTTGFDDPGISAIVWARPTESRALYIQGTGRGLRLAPGKLDCLILDVVDNCLTHKLVCALDLTGKDRADRPGGSGGGRSGPQPPQQKPDTLGFPVNWQLESVCPWPELPALEGYIPALPWHNDPATEAQFKMLGRFGLAAAEALSKGEASYLIDRALEFEAAFPVPASPDEETILKRHGLWTSGMGHRQALSLIANLYLKSRKLAESKR